MSTLTIFYDGFCPLCVREMAQLRRIDPDGDKLTLVEIQQGNLNTANVVEVSGRTRLVLNLKTATTYRTETKGNTVLVFLDPVQQASATAVARASRAGHQVKRPVGSHGPTSSPGRAMSARSPKPSSAASSHSRHSMPRLMSSRRPAAFRRGRKRAAAAARPG